jgi:hypothetical protein
MIRLAPERRTLPFHEMLDIYISDNERKLSIDPL